MPEPARARRGPRGGPPSRDPSKSRWPMAPGREQRPRRRERVRSDDASGHHVPQAFRRPLRAAVPTGLPVPERKHAPRDGSTPRMPAEGTPGRLVPGRLGAHSGEHPRQIRAGGDGQRRGRRRRGRPSPPGAAAARSRPTVHGRLGLRWWGEARPGHLPGQAQLVQPTGVVPGDPRRKDVTLPLAGGHLEALELLDDAEQLGASFGLRSGGDVDPRGLEPRSMADSAQPILSRDGVP